jgi:3-oxoacyl-[acyl-carrier protein] reductase
MDFTDKLVLVTGASRGIGRSIAQGFAEGGARVAVHYHRNLAAAQQTLESLPGGPHMIIRANIANADEVQSMVDEAAAEMGGLDILVNNAGIFEEHPPTEVDYATWQARWTQILQTNLIGAANASFCAVPHMLKRGGGRIVNVSSRGAFRGEPKAPAYGASKAGLNAMSQSLAVALAPHNIFVMVAAPGWVETDMADGRLTGAQGDAIRNQSPLGRIAKPEEVAYTVLFLASAGAEFLTGAVVDINGASYLRT